MPDTVDELLEEERAAWRPFEALGSLSDAQLEEPIAAAHDWSGRDLIAHVLGWLDDGLEVARELATHLHSPARERSRREFAARGDDINAEIQATWRQLPLGEVRRRLKDVPEELRHAVLEVPAASWTDPENLPFFHVYTVDHYQEHVADLEAILDAAG